VVFFEVFATANNNSPSYSENTCINNANEENLALKKSFTQCWDPLGMDYLAYSTAVRQSTNLSKPVDTSMCSIDNLADQRIDMSQVSEALNEENIERVQKQIHPDAESLGFLPAVSTAAQNKADMIKKECIVASMKRNPGNKGYVCEYPGDKNPKGINPTKQTISKYYGLAAGSTAQCADNQMSDYVHLRIGISKAELFKSNI